MTKAIFSIRPHPEAVLQQRLVAESSAEEHSLEDHQTTTESQLGGLGEAEGQRPICSTNHRRYGNLWFGIGIGTVAIQIFEMKCRKLFWVRGVRGVLVDDEPRSLFSAVVLRR